MVGDVVGEIVGNVVGEIVGNVVGEKVLDGYDLRLASQIPYLHWANAFVNSYKWSGEDRDDIEGTQLGSEIFLSPTLACCYTYGLILRHPFYQIPSLRMQYLV